MRGYVEEVARDPGPGQAVLYGTSRMFLERLGLNSLDDLPPLAEVGRGDKRVDDKLITQLEVGRRLGQVHELGGERLAAYLRRVGQPESVRSE